VISVAEVQSHLHASGGVDQIEVGPYLEKLCGSLAASMVGEGQPIALTVEADHGLIGSDKAVSIGLIVTELVINAIKYAFPAARDDARITVSFASDAEGWTLTVADNGVGKADVVAPPVAKHGGLGTVIVDALVRQLAGHMTVVSTGGVSVVIRHAHAGASTPVAA
jgi:chemotaxis protein methyltransferase CheR